MKGFEGTFNVVLTNAPALLALQAYESNRPYRTIKGHTDLV